MSFLLFYSLVEWLLDDSQGEAGGIFLLRACFLMPCAMSDCKLSPINMWPLIVTFSSLILAVSLILPHAASAMSPSLEKLPLDYSFENFSVNMTGWVGGSGSCGPKMLLSQVLLI